MSRFAVFVDAGYFWKQISKIIFGVTTNEEMREQKISREQISLSETNLQSSLSRILQREFLGYELLRVYWYDGYGANGTPSYQHKRLENLDDFKLRYGSRNLVGSQKGVDGLLMSDLILLAQNKAISSAMIVSGDADLVPGIETAQMLGIRIHRLEIGSSLASSPLIVKAVDKNVQWPVSEIRKFASPAESVITSSDIDNAKLAEVANNFITNLSLAEKDQLTAAAVQEEFAIPSFLDKKLLGLARNEFKRILNREELISIRSIVRKHFFKGDSLA